MRGMLLRTAVMIVIITLLVPLLVFAQEEDWRDKVGQSKMRQMCWTYHEKITTGSIFKNLEWRNVGPLVQSGRITDIDVPPGNHFTIFAAAASGGLWKTTNMGTTWEPIFDYESSITIGDIAVNPKDMDNIWVGTGENNSSRSSYAGTGVFKTNDGGKTWENMGLKDSHHIGRILIDPENSDIVYAAVIGHLYTKNEERGVFKTTDGGSTWEKILYIDDNTGVIDLVMDPEDNKILYAASWERIRKAWNFVEGGKGSGIYKSTDGGENWQKKTNGFPANELIGRIGIAVSPADPKIVYALVDNQNERPKAKDKVEEKEKPKAGLTIETIQKMSNENFLKLDKKKLDKFLRDNRIPRRFSADIVKDYIKNGKMTTKKIADYLLDANTRLFRTSIIGAEVYFSKDKGETWEKVNKKYLNGLYNTYGYYFGEIRVDPKDPAVTYILGVPLMKSKDSGKTYSRLRYRGVHSDHQALWIDPQNSDRLINGNDGGLNFSYDGGKTWKKINNMPLGQFYTVAVDNEKPYNIYGGLQDNGTSYGPVTSRPGITAPWKSVNGGDGAFVSVDPVETDIVYTESQFGYLSRVNKKTRKRKSIRPQAEFGEPPLRFNWLTPHKISPHNRYIVYVGAQKLFKSYNRGDNWHAISGDLTTNPGPEKSGDVPFGTITDFDESPVKPGLMYVGTDDGNVQVTKDGGATWKLVSTDLPDKWVTRVVASKYDEATAYVTLTGYRVDDFKKYVYKTENYGETWESIESNLPNEPVNVIREDPEYSNILYLGTDLTCYVSFNGGKAWHTLNGNLPTNAVYDIVIHPREGDIVIGTHGRSVFVMDLKWVRNMNDEIIAKAAHFFDPGDARIQKRYGRTYGSAEFVYYLKDNPQKSPLIEIRKTDGKKEKTIRKIDAGNGAGLNFVKWDLKAVPESKKKKKKKKKDEKEKKAKMEYVKPGTYKIVLISDKIKIEKTVKVLPDNNPDDDTYNFDAEPEETK